MLPKKESGKVRMPEANTREEAKPRFQEAFDAGERKALLVAALGQSHDACAAVLLAATKDTRAREGGRVQV